MSVAARYAVHRNDMVGSHKIKHSLCRYKDATASRWSCREVIDLPSKVPGAGTNIERCLSPSEFDLISESRLKYGQSMRTEQDNWMA